MFTQWSGVLYHSLKHKTQPSVLGLDTTRIANFVNYLKNSTSAVYLSIRTLVFSLQVILAKKIVHKSLPSLFQMYRHSLNIIFFCILLMNY